MRKAEALVSVIMPMRNTEQFVSAALKSILNGNEASIEIIVVDDNSTDRSQERVLGLGDQRIRIVPGPGAASQRP